MRQRFGKIALLVGIEKELQAEIRWIDAKCDGDRTPRFQATIYAYRRVIKMLRKYHVGWPANCKPPTQTATTEMDGRG